MKIDNFIIKEKSISRENLQQLKQLGVKFNRMNFMPPAATDKFTCVIEISVMISDNAGTGIAAAKLAYFVFATLEQEEYIQDQTANQLFSMMKLSYWQELNKLFQEVNLPPIPIANFFPEQK